MLRLFVSEYLCGGGWAGGERPASLVREGAAMLWALLRDLQRIPQLEIVTTWDCRCPLPEGCRVLADAAVEVIEVSGPDEEQGVFARLCREADATYVIAPELNDELSRRVSITQSCHHFNCSVEAIDLCGDKWALYEHFTRCGIPTIPTCRVGETSEAVELPWPRILKLRMGAGSQSMQLVSSPDEWEPAVRRYDPARRCTEAIAQPLIHGAALSIGAIIDREGNVHVLPVADQQIDLDQGFTYLGGHIPSAQWDHSLDTLVRDTLSTIPGLYGYVGVDLLIPECSWDRLPACHSSATSRQAGSLSHAPHRRDQSSPHHQLCRVSAAVPRQFGGAVDRRGASAPGSLMEVRACVVQRCRGVSMRTLIGLDIGGANIKASNGIDRTLEIPFPMWKDPDGLAKALRTTEPDLVEDPDMVAVTMTGELADCFRTKAEGVDRILDSIKLAFPRAELRVWQTGAEFFTEDEARDIPILVAAANWHALATWAGRACLEGAALLIDIGSTTTDIIPLSQGMPVNEGGTDPARLLSCELVYTGVRRTPLCALAPQIEFRGQRVGVAAELFATIRDVHLWLGSIPEAPDDCDTANGRPATREYARDRLVRMLCADSQEIDEPETHDLARQWASIQRTQIRTAVEQVLARQSSPPQMVLLSGEGEFIARQVLQEIPSLNGVKTLSLATVLGPEHSVGACAYAVARLAAERP